MYPVKVDLLSVTVDPEWTEIGLLIVTHPLRCNDHSCDIVFIIYCYLAAVEVQSIRKVKYTSICIAHFYAKRLKCAQT